MSEKTKQIIVIPGIMGSKLKQGLLKIWPCYIQRLGPTFIGDKLKYKENDNTIASGPVEFFYQKLINNLSRRPNTIVDFFSYDWRKNNLDQLSLLESIVRSDVDEVYIVAHSMGGIIAKLFLNYNKGNETIKNIKKLITIGTPWHGSPDAYKMILYGVENELLFLMSKDNSKDIMITFPSVYQLLPDQTYITRCSDEKKPTFLEEDRNELSWSDIYSHKYIPLINSHGLKEEEIFSNYYPLKDGIVEVEHHEIIGYGIATLYSIIKNSPSEAICEFNSGDARVPICSANSNAPFQYFIKETHQGLVKNDTVLSIINSIVSNEKLEQSSKVEYDYDNISKYKFTGKIFKVACPVIVSLIDEDGKTIYGNMDLSENPNIFLLDENKYNIVQIDNTLYLILEDRNDDDLTNEQNTLNNLNKLYIEAYDEGAVSISIEEFKKGIINRVSAFNSFNINSDISVELSVDSDMEDSTIVINESGVKTRYQKAITTKIHENAVIILPETKFEIVGDKMVFTDDKTIIFTADKFTLNINEIVAGTNPVLDTKFILNDKSDGILCKDDSVNFEFDPEFSPNTLKIYSVDILGNSEVVNEMKIFSIPDEKPNVKFSFYPKYYTLNVQDKHIDTLEAHNIKTSAPIIKLNSKNMYEEEKFEYNNIIDNIIIEYTNIYGVIYNFTVSIYKNVIQAILQGENNPNILNDFLFKIGLRLPYDNTSIQRYAGKKVKTINAENIYNSKEMSISQANFEICIYKDFRDIVSFQSLMEDIKLYDDKLYRFEFKVIDTLTANEITKLNLHANIQILLDNSFRNVYDIDIKYDIDLLNYVGLIDIKKLRFVLSQTTYLKERTNGIRNASLIIIQVSEINTTMRVHPITIR